MYVVTGATGQVGSAVVDNLLGAGMPVRVYVRSSDKGKALAERGAEVAVGTFEDVAALARALRGATSCFLMQANDFVSSRFVEDGRERVRGYVEAVRSAGGPRVVVLSSVGAQHKEGNGPIDREHLFERAFAEHADARILRASYFMENWANVADAVRGPGILPTFLDPDKKIAMVAAADIGAAVARLMRQAEGPRITELAGPVDYSPRDVAEAFSAIVGRSIQVAPDDTTAVVPMFVSLGFSEHIARLVQQMYEGYRAGTMAFEGEPQRGKTRLETTLRRLMAK